jgi:hypothetical protein
MGVKATSNLFSINCVGFERDRNSSGKTHPAPGRDSTKAGNTANITGFSYLVRKTMEEVYFAYGSCFEVIIKQSFLLNAVLAAFQ